jgi:tetratricopeptide (TPR) repeat protein
MKTHIGARWLAVSLFLPAVLAWPGPASAQDAPERAGERITILVPSLAPGQGLRPRFGEQAARELQVQIERLHTHRTVSNRDLRNALRRHNVRGEQLTDCLVARQLASLEGWGLVVCGAYEDAGGGQVRVVASFVAAETGESFDVEPFVVSERAPKEAAQRVLQTFDTWHTQLRHTLFCSDYVDIGQWDMAVTNCQQALALNPGSRAARYLLGHIYWNTDRHLEALGMLDELLELDPAHQEALKLAGIVATQMGDRPRARDYLDRYMELNPGDVRVRLTIATEIANAGDPEGALRFAQLGREIEPDNVDLINYIGHYAINAALLAEGKVAREDPAAPSQAEIDELFSIAADAFEEVLRARGDDIEPAVLERLTIARSRLGQVEQAVALGRRATEIAPDNGAIWEAYARALEEAGRIDDALAAIRRAEELGRAGPGLTQRAAQLFLRRGDTAGAIRTLRSAVDRGDMEAHDAWRTVFRYAYQTRYQAGQLAEAFRVVDQAAPLALTANDRMARNFWMGYFLFLQAMQAHEPQTVESAQRSKPMFERALQLFEASRGYERVEPSAQVLPRLIENCHRMIDIQNALIRRGR